MSLLVKFSEFLDVNIEKYFKLIYENKVIISFPQIYSYVNEQYIAYNNQYKINICNQNNLIKL